MDRLHVTGFIQSGFIILVRGEIKYLHWHEAENLQKECFLWRTPVNDFYKDCLQDYMTYLSSYYKGKFIIKLQLMCLVFRGFYF